MRHLTTIEAFYSAWSKGDIDTALAFCTDDVIAVNVPLGPINGKETLREFLKKFGAGMEMARYDIHHSLEKDNLVMLEGQENYLKDGHSVRLPYMAVFFFEGDLIREYRDYFDYATLKRQLAGDKDP